MNMAGLAIPDEVVMLIRLKEGRFSEGGGPRVSFQAGARDKM